MPCAGSGWCFRGAFPSRRGVLPDWHAARDADDLSLPTSTSLSLDLQCVDTQTDLDSCGGCPSQGGKACGDIAGVTEVGCVAGKCIGKLFACSTRPTNETGADHPTDPHSPLSCIALVVVSSCDDGWQVAGDKSECVPLAPADAGVN